MRNIIDFIPVFFVILGFVMVLVVIWNTPYTNETKKVSCYDEEHNKIKGLECEQVTVGVSLPGKIVATFISSVLSLTFIYFSLKLIW